MLYLKIGYPKWACLPLAHQVMPNPSNISAQAAALPPTPSPSACALVGNIISCKNAFINATSSLVLLYQSVCTCEQAICTHPHKEVVVSILWISTGKPRPPLPNHVFVQRAADESWLEYRLYTPHCLICLKNGLAHWELNYCLNLAVK